MKFFKFQTLFIVFLVVTIGLSLSMGPIEGFDAEVSIAPVPMPPLTAELQPMQVPQLPVQPLPQPVPQLPQAVSSVAAYAGMLNKISVNSHNGPHPIPCLSHEMAITDDGRTLCHPFSYSFDTPSASYKLFQTPR